MFWFLCFRKIIKVPLLQRNTKFLLNAFRNMTSLVEESGLIWLPSFFGLWITGYWVRFWDEYCWCHIYRLITAYLLLRVNLDKIMHARWDFDASSARTWRVSALDKHQNWSASALLCLNSRAQSKYAVVNLIHTRRKKPFCLLLCDKLDILVSLKAI